MEEYKDIQGYEGIYQVSNLGNVKSLARTLQEPSGKERKTKEKVLKSSLDNKGYPKLNLHLNNVRITRRVHRLVALALIPNPEGKEQVNHINGDKTDNSTSNLEWCTGSENMKHAYDTGLKIPTRGERSKSAKLTNQDVLDIRASSESTVALAKRYNVARQTIGYIVRRETWKHI